MGNTDVIVMDKLGYPQIEYIRKSDLTDDAIDRIAEAVAKKIENLCKNCQELRCKWRLAGDALERIDDAPTIDQVRHGKWVKNSDRAGWHCSACEKDNMFAFVLNIETGSYDLQDNYCPNCGARMEE